MSEFILGDCMEYLKNYPDNYFDLAIVDPPYGINICKKSLGCGGGVAKNKNFKQNKKFYVFG